MIRIATESDAGSVAEIYIRSRRLISYAKPAHTEEEIRLWIQNDLVPNGGVFVKDNGDGPLGMMALSTSDEGGWIDHLYVDPDFTNRGVGSELVEKAKEALEGPIWVYAFQQNHRARKFYEKMGFRAFSVSDGSQNEERCPDVLYVLKDEEHKAGIRCDCSRSQKNRQMDNSNRETGYELAEAKDGTQKRVESKDSPLHWFSLLGQFL